MSQAQLLPSSSAPSFPPLAYKGIPVLTTEMLAQAYDVVPKQIRQNFANNRERFIEGKHFFSLLGQELKDFRLCVENFDSQISTKVRALILYTARGCARHAKSPEHGSRMGYVRTAGRDILYCEAGLQLFGATYRHPLPHLLPHHRRRAA